MNRTLKNIIGILLYLTIPVVLAVIAAKAVKDHNGLLLIIVFGSLIVLSITLTIIRFVRHNRSK
jgi:hypothetical protein